MSHKGWGGSGQKSDKTCHDLFEWPQMNKIFTSLNFHLLGLIHTRHFDRQYCDKKTFLSYRYLKAKVSSQRNMDYLDLWFFKSLPWLFYRNQLTEIKISFLS